MSEDLVASATISIRSAPSRVWTALITPEQIKQYMFGADVASEWRTGSAISWKGEVKGKAYEDRGVILTIDPQRTLRYTHFSPLSGKPDRPENYHTVTIALVARGPDTSVTLTQDNNADDKARKESEANWGMMLGGLKKYLERAA